MISPGELVARWLATSEVAGQIAAAKGVRYFGPPIEGRTAQGPGRSHPVHFVDAPDGVAVGEGSAVWSWWTDDSLPLTVQDLTCKVPSDDGPSHELVVATELRWSSVEVSAGWGAVSLPLDLGFVLARLVIKGGTDPSAESSVGVPLDECIALLFAAAVTIGERGPALSPLGERHDGSWIALSWTFRTGLATRCLDIPILGAPMETSVTVFGTPAVHSLSASLRLERPDRTRMIGCDADVENRYRSRAEGGTFAAPPEGGILCRPWVLAPLLRPTSLSAPPLRQVPFGHHDALHWWPPRGTCEPQVTCAPGFVALQVELRSTAPLADETVTIRSGMALFGM